ncbi:MAG: hypothetical protein ACJA1C_000970 [Crocinitomicaceae bacterium]|jgi:hypothetical protein
MRGMDFKNFADFRETFWKMVGNDPELSANFGPDNVTRMKDGKAPYVVSSEATGGGSNAKYQLNHIDPIKSGGGVYDISNLEVVSPKTHIEVGQ